MNRIPYYLFRAAYSTGGLLFSMALGCLARRAEHRSGTPCLSQIIVSSVSIIIVIRPALPLPPYFSAVFRAGVSRCGPAAAAMVVGGVRCFVGVNLSTYCSGVFLAGLTC